jgi:hypothetical protein
VAEASSPAAAERATGEVAVDMEPPPDAKPAAVGVALEDYKLQVDEGQPEVLEPPSKLAADVAAHSHGDAATLHFQPLCATRSMPPSHVVCDVSLQHALPCCAAPLVGTHAAAL